MGSSHYKIKAITEIINPVINLVLFEEMDNGQIFVPNKPKQH